MRTFSFLLLSTLVACSQNEIKILKTVLPKRVIIKAIPPKLTPIPFKIKEQAETRVLIAKGKVSWFGGSNEYSKEAKQPCALYPHIRVGDLDENEFYVACRWDYGEYSPSVLRSSWIIIRANEKEIYAKAYDWGPGKRTGRAIDMSPGALNALGLKTNDAASAYIVLGE